MSAEGYSFTSSSGAENDDLDEKGNAGEDCDEGDSTDDDDGVDDDDNDDTGNSKQEDNSDSEDEDIDKRYRWRWRSNSVSGSEISDSPSLIDWEVHPGQIGVAIMDAEMDAIEWTFL